MKYFIAGVVIGLILLLFRIAGFQHAIATMGILTMLLGLPTMYIVYTVFFENKLKPTKKS